jgi:hypothetical protein
MKYDNNIIEIEIINKYACNHYSKPYTKYYFVYLKMKLNYKSTEAWCSTCHKISKVSNIIPYKSYLRKEKLLKLSIVATPI